MSTTEYTLGRMAYYDGKLMSSNPYTENSKWCNDWDNGYHDAIVDDVTEDMINDE